MEQLRNTTWVAALCAFFLVVGCDDENPATDAGPVGLMDAGPGTADAGPGPGVDSGPGPGVDSGPGPGVDGGPGGDCSGPTGECDVTDPTSCGAGMACLINGSSMDGFMTICGAAGVGGQGAACTPGMAGQCQEGFQCDSGSSTCQAFCCDSTDCSPGDFCSLISRADVGFCQTPVDCDLIAQTGCPDMQGCYPSGGGLACFDEGTGAEGESCMFTNECLPGFGCLGSASESFCREFCDMMATDPCPTGFTCQPITDLPVGGCIPDM